MLLKIDRHVWFLLFFLLCYFSLAVFTGLKGGALLGVFYISLLIFAFYHGRTDVLLILYLLIFFIGSFKIIKWDDGFYFDGGFFLSILVFVYFCSKGIIPRVVIYLVLTFVCSILFNINNYTHYAYQSLGSMFYFVIFGVLISITSKDSKLISCFVSLLFLIFISIYLLQFFGLLGSLNQYDAVYFFGVEFWKPSGVSGSIYQAGTKLLTLYILLLYYSNCKLAEIICSKFIKFLVFFLILFLCSLSQKSIFLGVLVYALIFILVIILKRFFVYSQSVFILFFLSLPLLVFALFILIEHALYYLDPSNAFKVFMWKEMYKEFSDFCIGSVLFGNGLGTSIELMKEKDFSDLAAYYSISGWDIQVFKNGILPHNIFVQLVYETGILFSFSFFVILIFYIMMGFNHRETSLFCFLMVVLCVNDFLHNGVFSVLLSFLVVIVMQRYRSKMVVL